MIDLNATFLADVKSLFLGEKQENMGSYLYSTPDPTIEDDPVNGEKYYREAILENPDYYLYKDEVELINKVAKKIAAYVTPEANIIEFGPGTKTAFTNKSLPFLKAVGKFNSYIPIDLCETYLRQSEEILGRELPEIPVKQIKTDFIKNLDLVKDFSLPIIFFKGSTITNLSRDNCLDFLARISQALQPDSILIVGVDANQNEPSLRKAYYNNKAAKFVLNILYLINRDLPITNFNPTAFKYEVEWVESFHCVKQNAIATEDQNFVLDGIPIEIKKGTKFHFLSSYKYPVDYFQNLAKTAGLKSLDCFVDENKRMVIHVLGVS